MEAAVAITVIMEIHTDLLGLFQTPDMTLTRQNQMLRDWLIFQGKTNKQTNKNGRLLSFPFTIHQDT